MACEYVATVIAINKAIASGPHPHDVASGAFGDDRCTAAVIDVGYAVQVNAGQVDAVSHEVNMYAGRTFGLYAYANQICAVIGTDERACSSIVVTAGVG